MQFNGIDVVAVWPRQGAVLDEHPREIVRVVQRAHHLAVAGHHVREVPDSYAAVREGYLQPIGSEAFQPDHVNHRPSPLFARVGRRALLLPGCASAPRDVTPSIPAQFAQRSTAAVLLGWSRLGNGTLPSGSVPRILPVRIGWGKADRQPV